MASLTLPQLVATRLPFSGWIRTALALVFRARPSTSVWSSAENNNRGGYVEGYNLNSNTSGWGNTTWRCGRGR